MGCGDEKLSKYLTQTFTAHCNAMICQQVTLSGDAEWPKVADAVIEAPFHYEQLWGYRKWLTRWKKCVTNFEPRFLYDFNATHTQQETLCRRLLALIWAPPTRSPPSSAWKPTFFPMRKAIR